MYNMCLSLVNHLIWFPKRPHVQNGSPRCLKDRNVASVGRHQNCQKIGKTKKQGPSAWGKIRDPGPFWTRPPQLLCPAAARMHRAGKREMVRRPCDLSKFSRFAHRRYGGCMGLSGNCSFPLGGESYEVKQKKRV